MIIITRTPLRISLAGGGSDLPVFFEKEQGAVVSFTINKYVYVIINKRFEKGLRISYSKTENVNSIDEIQHDIIRETLRYFNIKESMEVVTVGDVPGNGTGLGSSSALAVGLGKALLPDNTPPQALAEFAYEIERLRCHHSCGKQDMYASACGGLNKFSFSSKSVSVHPVGIPEWLQDWLLLLWTGTARSSEPILQSQQIGIASDPNKFAAVKAMATQANILHTAFGLNGVANIGKFLNDGWASKKLLEDNITTPEIDKWYVKAIAAGAYGGKLLGAGGGGFLLFFVPPGNRKDVIAATGLPEMKFQTTHKGSEVIYGTNT